MQRSASPHLSVTGPPVYNGSTNLADQYTGLDLFVTASDIHATDYKKSDGATNSEASSLIS